MKFLLTVLLFTWVAPLAAQVKITGKTLTQKGKPLAGVSIVLKDTYDGATSDSLGNFSFTSTEKGKQVLEFTLSGYGTYSKNIELDNGAIALGDILLKELITELKAVVISAGAFEAGDKKKTTVLSSLDIVTTASAEGDITGALKTLPGTQQVGETGGLFVRGGTATEAKIYIDGTLVNNFFYSSLPGIASRGRFNPFLFKGTVFSSGGYSALYGQALSSALILESNDLPERTESNISVSVIGLGGGIQKLAKNKQSSWGATYNFAHLGLAFAVIRQKQDYFKVPIFHEGDLNYRKKLAGGGMLKYFGYWSVGKLGYRVNDIDSAALLNSLKMDNVNTYQNISMRNNLGKGWKLHSALSFSTDKQKFVNELQDAQHNQQLFYSPAGYIFKNNRLNTQSFYSQARMVVEKRLKGLSMLRAGADYFYSREQSTYTLFDNSQYKDTLSDHLFAGFAEADFYLSNQLAVKLGSRLEHSRIMKQWNIAPRVSLAYKLSNNSQASLAYGIFYQNPESQYLPMVVSKIGYASATHYIAQYQKITSLQTFRTELFYKKYNHLFTTGSDAYGRQVAASNDGNGYAQGVEFFWRDKKSIKNMDYWLSYSFLDTKRSYLNYPQKLEPNFVAKHTASLVLKKFIMPWKMNINASYSFATGRPYYHLKYDNSQGKYIVADAGRTRAYNSLGFSINYLPSIGKQGAKSFSVWVLSISNLLGQKQVFNYQYGELSGRKQAVGPTSKRFVYIGWFISFGTDQTENVINNNL